MDLQNVLVLLAAALTFAACFVFVVHRDYHTGFWGMVFLALIAAAAATRILGIVDAWWDERVVHVTTPGVMLWIGLAGFLARQLWRFIARRKSATFYVELRGLGRSSASEKCEVV